MSKSAFVERVGHFDTKYYVEGYANRQNTYTVR